MLGKILYIALLGYFLHQGFHTIAWLFLLHLGQDYIIPAPEDLMATFEAGSDVTQLTVPIQLINDGLDEHDIQFIEVRLEIVTAVNPDLLILQHEFTGEIQDDEGKWVLQKTFSQNVCAVTACYNVIYIKVTIVSG